MISIETVASVKFSTGKAGSMPLVVTNAEETAGTQLEGSRNMILQW
jgi:hypothetical protein